MIKVPFNEAKFKQLAQDCTAEYVNYMPRGKNGMRLCFCAITVIKPAVKLLKFIRLLTAKNATKKFAVYIMKKAFRSCFWQIYLI